MARIDKINEEVKRERIDLRYTPEFVFELDDSIEHGANIERLLNNINKK